MAIFAKTERYNGVTILFHWVIAALVIFMLWYGKYVSDLPKGSFERLEGFQNHFSIGITILILMLLRLVWRLGHKAPPMLATMSRWEKILAKAVHYLFYVALIVMPLAGWASATTSPLEVPIRYFDLFQFPWFPGLHGLEEASREIVNEVFEDLHETTAWVVLGLVSLHVLAVIYHTVLLRDATLKRMLPGK